MPTERPMCIAVSRADNSPSSFNWMALRISGLNCLIAADKIRAPSFCEQLASGSGPASASSKGGVVAPGLLKSSIGTSLSARRLRSNINAWLMAMRVAHVENEDFPSNLWK